MSGLGGHRWSVNETSGARASSGCPRTNLALPDSDPSTSHFMELYAADETQWINDFVAVMNKMQSNGYSQDDLTEGPQPFVGVSCSARGSAVQCWTSSPPVGDSFYIESKLDGLVMEVGLINE